MSALLLLYSGGSIYTNENDAQSTHNAPCYGFVMLPWTLLRLKHGKEMQRCTNTTITDYLPDIWQSLGGILSHTLITRQDTNRPELFIYSVKLSHLQCTHNDIVTLQKSSVKNM